MTTIYGLGNDVELDLNNSLSEAESDEDERENEIKELLAGALNNETFYDDDESEASFGQSSIFQRNRKQNSDNENDISLHSFHSNPNLANISKNGFSFLNGYSNNNNQVRNSGDSEDETDIRRRLENNSKPRQPSRQADRGSDEIEAQNATVSLMHQNHCPQQNGGVEESSHGCIGMPSNADSKEHLKSLCDFRERQIGRCEETISMLTKDKRALNHQVGLMRSEMVQLRGTQDDLDKAIRLKNEEIIYMKTKIQEALTEYENLKRGETDLKDENNRLRSEISRLEQEVKLASTIGSSVQQAEVNEIVRQVREKHARETASWKRTIADLEGQIRDQKKNRLEQEVKLASTIGSSVQQAEVNEIIRQVREEHARETALWKSTIADLEGQIRDQKKNRLEQEVKLASTIGSSVQQAEVNEIIRQVREEHARETASWKSTIADLEGQIRYQKVSTKQPTKTSEAQVSVPVQDVATQSAETTDDTNLAKPTNTFTTTFVQTDESLKTYEVLAELIEQWAREVSDSVKRAEVAESQARFSEDSLKKLRKKFKDVTRIVSVCRKEWKSQEQLLLKKHAETKAHYMNLLLKLGQKLDSLEGIDTER